MRIASLLLLLTACAGRKAPEPPQLDAYAAQQELASEESRDQVLHQVRLASMAIARGDDKLARDTLRASVGTLQDFRAEGQFAAMIGAEERKGWRGEPFEKMMAFLYLGVLMYEDGQYGNALAMSKSAILADTGSNQERFRSDFVPAFVLQSLAFGALGEDRNAERSLEQAIDALYLRRLTDEMSALLLDVPTHDVKHSATAQALLLAGLSAGLTAHPREPLAAVDASLSFASDLRKVSLQSSKKTWLPEIQPLSKHALRGSFDALEPMTLAWKAKVEEELPPDLFAELDASAESLQQTLDDPSLVLFVESGAGPSKQAVGRYNEVLQIVESRDRGAQPTAFLNKQFLSPVLIDDITYQAQTRGGRRVDGFLKGKAVFKDSSGVLGYSLLVGGDVASSAENGALAAALYIAGAAVWISGAITNPAADVRQWGLLPDQLWVTTANPLPGTHTLVLDGRTYTVDIPDKGTTLKLIPRLQPHGSKHFGTPCTQCETELAIPKE